jgi:ADP-dependent NAD(P)H-hydrate dehydratase / NAD(P)H-hydrate epimerase
LQAQLKKCRGFKIVPLFSPFFLFFRCLILLLLSHFIIIMKIISNEQMKAADNYTVANEPISYIELMEKASLCFVGWFVFKFTAYQHKSISILAGLGNNGGDGLVIARLLAGQQYEVAVFIINHAGTETEGFKINLERLQLETKIAIQRIDTVEDLPVFDKNELIIDAMLGAGLTRELSDELLDITKYINECENLVVAVDIPTGVFADIPTTGVAIEADFTYSFQLPKLSFLFPENYHYVGEFEIGDIGLSAQFLEDIQTENRYVDKQTVLQFFKKRDKFSHKGVFGHALLIVGSHGKMGAAVLATKACLRAGTGLVTAHIPNCGHDIMQTSVPEAMVSLDEDEHIFTRIYELQKYNTVALGCGLSTKNKTRNALCYVLKNLNAPAVIDADALNILSQTPDWLELLPKNSILTPHPKEFERLFGTTHHSFERNELQRAKAQELGIYIILKGANTCIATPEGVCYFNSTGNPGMGTAGSGDVLTGILASLLAQGYSPLEACLLGVYLHGLSGDIAAKKLSQESLISGDLIEYLGAAFLSLHEKK